MNIIEKITPYLKEYGEKAIDKAPLVVGALAILLIGLWIIGKVSKMLGLRLEKKLDVSLSRFLTSLISIFLKVLLFITVARIVGIDTTSFAVILGALGLAVGMALQGSLANFAGGVMLMVLRPFKVGDLIEGLGKVGEVKEVGIVTTTLTSLASNTIILPNGELANSTIINYTTIGHRRVDLQIGIGYNDNIKKAKDVIMEVMQNNPKVLKTPAATVNVGELGDSAIVLEVRPFSKVAEYWDVYFSTLEDCKVALDNAGISIPYPQTDVHLHKIG